MVTGFCTSAPATTPTGTAPSLDNLLGKVLRIESDGSIPTDNPFYENLEGDNRAIWAYGFRNPFSLAYSGDDNAVYINDVGDKAFEELNLGIAGGFYGWPDSEGPTDDLEVISPIYSYPGESVGTTVCIIGGEFYEDFPEQFPEEFVGRYFFADYEQGWIHTLDFNGEVVEFATEIPFPTSVHFGADGSLFYLSRSADSGGQPETGGAASDRLRRRRAPAACRRSTGHHRSAGECFGNVGKSCDFFRDRHRRAAVVLPVAA